jgi:glycerol uptake operon antiterminator
MINPILLVKQLVKSRTTQQRLYNIKLKEVNLLSWISDILVENPVIAAIKSKEDLEQVIKSSVKIVFVLYGSIISIADDCKILKAHGKTVFIHVDLIDGLRGDLAGIEFIKKQANPDGILTTKANVIRYAKQFNLETILRIFILDSLSLKTGIKNINETSPSAVEIMPGIVCKIINEFEKKIEVPFIAGGLIVKKEQILESLSAGAIAISTTKSDLWNL